jgi:hypothetical protein
LRLLLPRSLASDTVSFVHDVVCAPLFLTLIERSEIILR